MYVHTVSSLSTYLEKSPLFCSINKSNLIEFSLNADCTQNVSVVERKFATAYLQKTLSCLTGEEKKNYIC